MEDFINQLFTVENLSEIIRVGGQYLLPLAALLRAIYHGLRRHLSRIMVDIAGASVVAGLTAVANNPAGGSVFEQVGAEILTNSLFMAAVMAFIVIYLLRMPNLGRFVDSIVGAVVGFIIWFVWGVMLEDWPAWSVIIAVFGAAAGFVMLRLLYRRADGLLRLARWAITLGLILLVGAGVFWLISNLQSGTLQEFINSLSGTAVPKTP